MHFQLVDKTKQTRTGIWCGVWLAAALLALLSTIDSIQYFYTAIPGVALVIAASFLPKKWQKRAAIIVLSLCAVWLIFRFKFIFNGIGISANKLFKLSEDAQNYFYVYFKVFGKNPVEALFFISCLLGALCVLIGNIVNMVLTLLIAIVIAYFCVAPNILWLSVLVIVAFSNALPKKGRWLPAILVTVIVAVTAFSVQYIAPEPNAHISYFIANFWDIVIPSTKPVETPTPIITPETQVNPDIPKPPEPQNPQDAPTIETPPDEEQSQIQETPGIMGGSPMPQMPNPDQPGMGKLNPGIPWGTITKIAGGIAFIALIIGIWLAVAAKKRKQNRAALYVQDNAEAIRAMYLYAKRWNKLNVFPTKMRGEINDMWLEAIFSEHEMTKEQRETMLKYVRYSAADAWNTLGTWERLAVYLYHAL